MKTMLLLLCVVCSTSLFARTGSVSGDSIVLWLPLSVLGLIWLVSFVKKKYQQHRQDTEHVAYTDNN